MEMSFAIIMVCLVALGGIVLGIINGERKYRDRWEK